MARRRRSAHPGRAWPCWVGRRLRSRRHGPSPRRPAVEVSEVRSPVPNCLLPLVGPRNGRSSPCRCRGSALEPLRRGCLDLDLAWPWPVPGADPGLDPDHGLGLDLALALTLVLTGLGLDLADLALPGAGSALTLTWPCPARCPGFGQVALGSAGGARDGASSVLAWFAVRARSRWSSTSRPARRLCRAAGRVLRADIAP
jgi:hypothetical protein